LLVPSLNIHARDQEPQDQSDFANVEWQDDARPEKVCERRPQECHPTEAGDHRQHSEKPGHERRFEDQATDSG
jgi:hypothetical protein